MDFPTQVEQVCGDSFAGQGVGFGGYYSPIALRVDTSSVDDPEGVRYTGVTGVTEPLLADPTPPGESQLPAGVVQINRQNYLLITTTKNLVPQNSRLVKAEPTQGFWQTVPGSVREAGYASGQQSQISGYYDPIPTPESQTGWVYIVADSFDDRLTHTTPSAPASAMAVKASASSTIRAVGPVRVSPRPNWRTNAASICGLA